MRFTPTKDFHDPELRSSYCKGLSYTVGKGPVYDKLREKVKTWLAEGKVVESAEPQVVAGTNRPSPGILRRLFSWL